MRPILYLGRPFREEFIEKISEIAPDYQVVTELDPNSAKNVAISVGWPEEYAEELLSGELRWVQALSAGVDRLPLKELSKHSVLVSNASGLHAISISEHVLGVLLAHFRGIDTAVQQQIAAEWSPKTIQYRQLAGNKILIVGTGKIGQQLAVSAKGLCLNVYGINTNGHVVEGFAETYSMNNLPKVIGEMDIIVDILPETKETYHLFKKSVFNLMKEGAVFMNVGRGETVIEDDLSDALMNGPLSFAALDVFEEEPLPSNSPLWKLDNLLITPHIAGLTPNFEKRFMEIFLKNLKSYINDQSLALNQVDLAKGY